MKTSFLKGCSLCLLLASVKAYPGLEADLTEAQEKRKLVREQVRLKQDSPTQNKNVFKGSKYHHDFVASVKNAPILQAPQAEKNRAFSLGSISLLRLMLHA